MQKRQKKQSGQESAKIQVIDREAQPKRLYTKVYHDFLKCPLLESDEKALFIVLKSFLNFDDEKEGRADGDVYPSQETMAKMLHWSRQRVGRAITKLENKRIIKTTKRGKSETDIYSIADYPEIWQAESIEEMQEAAELPAGARAARKLTDAELLEEMQRRGLISAEDVEKGPEDMEKGPRYWADTESPEKKFVSKEKNTFHNTNITTDSVYEQSQTGVLGVYGHTMRPTTPENDVQEPTLQPTTDAAELEKLVNAAVSDMAVKNTGLPLEWSEADTADAIARFRGAANVRSARAYMREICRDIMQAKQATGTGAGAGTRAGRQGAGKPPAGKFANFEQRKYDSQALEQALLISQGLLTEDQPRELSGQIQETGTRQKDRQDRRQTGRETCPPRK